MHPQWIDAPSELKLSPGMKELILPIGSDKTASILCHEDDIPQLEKLYEIREKRT